MIDDPKRVVKDFMVREGSTVADLGVGYGHYAYALSEAVGEQGKVFAVDIQKNLLERLKKESDEKGIKNIEIIWGDVEIVGGTKLRADSVDAGIIVNVLFQVESKAGLVREAGRILKVGGKLLVLDWTESFGSLGPQPNMVVDAETARRVFETGQFEFQKNINAGEHHYGMVFVKKSS
jgi:ubiquinone/menaquinone biosynthesis C-methylase UbiE